MSLPSDQGFRLAVPLHPTVISSTALPRVLRLWFALSVGATTVYTCYQPAFTKHNKFFLRTKVSQRKHCKIIKGSTHVLNRPEITHQFFGALVGQSPSNPSAGTRAHIILLKRKEGPESV